MSEVSENEFENGNQCEYHWLKNINYNQIQIHSRSEVFPLGNGN